MTIEEVVKKYKPLFDYLVKAKIHRCIRKSVVASLLPEYCYFNANLVMQELMLSGAFQQYGSSWALTTETKEYLAECAREEDPLYDAKTAIPALLEIYKPLFKYIKDNNLRNIGRREAHKALANESNIPDDLMEELTSVGLFRKRFSTWVVTDICATAIAMPIKPKSLNQQIQEGVIEGEKQYKPANVKEILASLPTSHDTSNTKHDTKHNTKKKEKPKKLEIPVHAQSWYKVYTDDKAFAKYVQKQEPDFSIDELTDTSPNDFIGNGIYASLLSEYRRTKGL